MNNFFGKWFGGGLIRGLPFKSAALLWQQRSNDSGTRMIDRLASGNYEVEQGHSTSFDGVMHGKLVDDTGADTSVTLTTGLSYTYKFSIALGTTGAVQYIRDGNSASNRFQVYIDATNDIVATGSVEIDGVASTLLDTNPHNVVITGTGTNEIFAILGATYLFASQIDAEIWDEELIVDGVTVFSNFLAQQSDIGLMESEVGPNVQLVNFPADYIHLDNTYGHTWSGYSEDVLGADLIVNGGFDIDSDWSKGAGWTISDGAGVASSATAGSRLSQTIPDFYKGQDYMLSFDAVVTGGNISCFLGGNSVVTNFSTGSYNIVVTAGATNDDISFDALSTLSATIDNVALKRNITGKIPQDPTNPGYDVAGNALTNPGTPQRNAKVYGYWGNFDGVAYLSMPHLTGTETVTFSSGDAVPTVGVGQVTFTVGSCGRLTLDDGTDLIIQGDSNVTGQGTCYDISGNSNHATLTNFPDPFFTVQKEGSQLLAGGFELGTELWPIPANPTTGLSALGQPLTHAPWILTPDHPVDIEMIPNVEGYEADQIAGNQYYEVDGTLKQVDAANIATNQGDTEFFGLKGIAIYLTAQAAATVTKILKYIKPFT